MQWLRALVAKSPSRALVLGKAVFLVGCILILGAAFARAALIGINDDRSRLKQPALHTLAEAYPQLPTWMVPEGSIGYGVAAVLVVIGMAVTVAAGEAVKQQREQRRRTS